MLLEGVLVHAPLETEADQPAPFFEIRAGDDSIVKIHIPAGDSRGEMMGQASSLKVGEKVDLYVFVRDWEYEDRHGEKQTGSLYYVRGIALYA